MTTILESYGRPEEAVQLVPTSALGGAYCGLVCEICPLRPWKSVAITGVICTDILADYRVQLDAQRAKLLYC